MVAADSATPIMMAGIESLIVFSLCNHPSSRGVLFSDWEYRKEQANWRAFKNNQSY